MRTNSKSIFFKLFLTISLIVLFIILIFVSIFEINFSKSNIFYILFIVFISFSLISYISKKISRPLNEMVDSARNFAQGQFSNKIKSSNISEINSLAQSLNGMAKQLNDRINTITFQKNENEAILWGMKDGLLATNRANEIIKINEFSSKLFDLKENVLGIDIRTVIRNKNFLEFYSQVCSNQSDIGIESEIDDINKKSILCSGSSLKAEDGSYIGNVIVVRDITMLKNLEKVRKEFVANVSHELRTPITALQGYIETLKDVVDKEDREYFLKIIEKNALRMNSIIDDLLQLSKLEESNQSGLDMKEVNIQNLIAVSVNECSFFADKKNIKINISCENIKFCLNDRLIRESLVNLIKNSIQYSPSNSSINISAFYKNKELYLKVEDHGIGIEKKELDRIFERFYCVDRSHSKKTGGTGLGLSIVKHIATIHRGRILVDSELDKGSVFTLIIPE